jgi:hypothetical protein
MGFDAVGEMLHQKEHACEAIALRQQNLMFEIRPPTNSHHRLRDCLRMLAEPCAPPASQNYHLHVKRPLPNGHKYIAQCCA